MSVCCPYSGNPSSGKSFRSCMRKLLPTLVSSFHFKIFYNRTGSWRDFCGRDGLIIFFWFVQGMVPEEMFLKIIYSKKETFLEKTISSWNVKGELDWWDVCWRVRISGKSIPGIWYVRPVRYVQKKINTLGKGVKYNKN